MLISIFFDKMIVPWEKGSQASHEPLYSQPQEGCGHQRVDHCQSKVEKPLKNGHKKEHNVEL